MLSLFVHLFASAATQTAYGADFSMLRWYSLFALAGFGGLHWIIGGQTPLRMKSVNTRVLIYFALWGLTVVNSEYPLFSSYRLLAHAMIVVSALVFIPPFLRTTDASKLLLALKVIVAVILVASYFWPAPLNRLDVINMYRGIFGDANSLGHMSAVGCLLFLHGFFIQRRGRWGQLQGALAGLAGIMLIQSGARSSFLTLLAGLLVFYLLYRSQLPRYVAILGIIGAVSTPIIFPSIQEDISRFVFKKSTDENASTLVRVLSSHQPVLDKHWEGFKERPLLGWGFGLDKDTKLSRWNGSWSSTAATGRDPVNDIMYTLESGGVVGLFSYVFLLSVIFKAWIPAAERSMLKARLRQPGYEPLSLMYETQKIFYCLAAALIVMFEFDNTALSAGNFFAALLWVSLGLALGMYSVLMYSLRRPAPIPNSLRRPTAALPLG
jgi:O-antigen ligase